MAISVDPSTHVISVPKADIGVTQVSPEVRTLDLNVFRMWLKDWEDSEEGMPQLKTHNHNTEVTLSGLTYARIVEVLDPYTVEFEDDQYSINCTGANHNLADVRVANQVSLIINNAAGLISNSAIEYASYNGGVTYDSTSSYSGSLFPVGTPQQPVNNLTDLLLIASTRGLKKIYINSDLDVDSTYTLDGFTIVGENKNNLLTIDTSAIITELTTQNLMLINSIVDDEIDAEDCFIKDCTLVGTMISCGLSGDIVLSGGKKSVMKDCYTYDQDDPPVIDMGGSGNDLAMPGYSGLATIQNLTGASNEVGIGLDHGMIILDSTVTAGTSIVIGIGAAIDNSTGTHVLTDTYLLDPSHVREVRMLQGLDANNPMTVTPTSRIAGSINQVISGDGETTTTVTRQ